MNYPTNTWQELNWNPAFDSPDFFQFCNNITDLNAAANITSVDMQLANYTNGSAWTGLGAYANYVKEVVVSTCESEDLINTTTCFGTQNSKWSVSPYVVGPKLIDTGRDLLRYHRQFRGPLLPLQHMHRARRIPSPPTEWQAIPHLPRHRPRLHPAMVHVGLSTRTSLATSGPRTRWPRPKLVQQVWRLQYLGV